MNCYTDVTIKKYCYVEWSSLIVAAAKQKKNPRRDSLCAIARPIESAISLKSLFERVVQFRRGRKLHK